ncbi:MAG: outer membrane protein assembly factor BamE [Gammaproteobacteria bacterium]
MRQLLIPALLLSLLAGCSSVNIGPHRIDVQQGNALDQENVARLKPGLNRSQVRFLLGTPLVVDPFRTDRWDYVYVYHKAGRLAEQKRITLFFEGDTLVRIEGDLPPKPEPAPEAVPAPAAKPAPQPAPQPTEPPAATETRAMPAEPVPQPRALTQPEAADPMPQRAAAERATPTPAPQPAPRVAVEAAPQPMPEPAPQPESQTAAQPARQAVPVAAATPSASAPAVRHAVPATSIVAPLPSPKDAPPYPNKRPPAELALQPETDVAQIQPDVIPPFPEPETLSDLEAAVLASVKAWSDAWARRDEDGYLAAYDASFIPQGGGSRDDWEKRRRLLLGVARNIDLQIDSPTVERVAEGVALVTFNQHYRSDSYRDSVVKQMRLVERDGRWLIAEERVLTILRGARQ